MTHVVQADATDAEALRQIGAADFSRAAVTIGTDIQASILATYALVDLGVARIWAKAVTPEHAAILERVGAHRVVLPEREMGVRVAHTMVGRTIDYVELDEDFVLIETTTPRDLTGETLKDAGLRSRYGVTVVAVKTPEGGSPTRRPRPSSATATSWSSPARARRPRPSPPSLSRAQDGA